jgi:hypothetical protein
MSSCLCINQLLGIVKRKISRQTVVVGVAAKAVGARVVVMVVVVVVAREVA